jgi:hypothetical protein
VMKIMEPIKYAVGIFKGEDAVTEGSLLRDPRDGKILTVNIDVRRYRDLGLLWPDQKTTFVTPFY